MDEKRILDVIPSSGLDTVCSARKKIGRKKTSYSPSSKKNQYGQWHRRKKKTQIPVSQFQCIQDPEGKKVPRENEDQMDKGYGQLDNEQKKSKVDVKI